MEIQAYGIYYIHLSFLPKLVNLLLFMKLA